MTSPSTGWMTLRRAIDGVFERLGCFDERGEWRDTPEADAWRAQAHAIYAAADALAQRRGAYPTLLPPGALSESDLQAELRRVQALPRGEDTDLPARYAALIEQTLAVQAAASAQSQDLARLRVENGHLRRQVDSALIVTTSRPRKRLPPTPPRTE